MPFLLLHSEYPEHIPPLFWKPWLCFSAFFLLYLYVKLVYQKNRKGWGYDVATWLLLYIVLSLALLVVVAILSIPGKFGG